MAYDSILPLPLGKTSTNGDLEAFVGKEFKHSDGYTYRLVQAYTTGALTAPANKVVVVPVATTGPDWDAASLSATSSNPNVAGIGDPSLSGNVAASAYFWVVTGPDATVNSGSGISANSLVRTHTTTAGSCFALAINAATSAVVNQSLAFGRALTAHSTTTSTCRVKLLNVL